MGWLEFLGWLKVHQRQMKGQGTSPDSWDGADSDGWWAEQRRRRDEERR